MPRALILGGTGLVGRATAIRLLDAGWEVDVTGRDPQRMPAEVHEAGGCFLGSDRDDQAQLASAVGSGADLLVDCICFTSAQASRLLHLLRDVTSTVMISSKAVYIDDAGNHSNSDIQPDFGAPVAEAQPTMTPSDEDFNSREGYGANKVAAEQLLLDSGHPVTVLRPSKIHGKGATQPREWVFVKRILDKRRTVLLGHRGTGGDHPSAAANVAALIHVVSEQPGRRILNSADPDAPNGIEIARTIASLLGHHWDEVLLDDGVDKSLGRHPWDRRPPVVLDMRAAEALGYRPVGNYAATVGAEVEWLVSAARLGDPGGVLPPADDDYFAQFLDYDAEDRYLAAAAKGHTGLSTGEDQE